MNIGILTGGGDCPGLNAVIRAVVRRGLHTGHVVTGFEQGWQGVYENRTVMLGRDEVAGILHRGGTILGTSRFNPFAKEGGEERIRRSLNDNAIDALIVVGGEDTLGVAQRLHEGGINVIGVPKTIDNDLNGTDVTFGFDTAINIAMEAIDRLHTTAESHHRVIVVEVMGRHSGWIAFYAGISGGADVILIPEHPFSIEKVCNALRRRHESGRTFSIVVVSEGAKFMTGEPGDQDGSYILSSMKKDAFGHVRLGGIGSMLAAEIEKRLDYETRATVLGHVQRGGTPTAADRMLGTRFGIAAVEFAEQEKFGFMVALQGNALVPVSISEAVGKLKTVPDDLYKIVESFVA